MAKANIGAKTTLIIDTAWDDVVIELLLEDVTGGRTLSTEGITEDVFKAGRVVIEEDATGEVKLLKIVGEAYEDVPVGHTVMGILYRTVTKDFPLGPIMVRGTVNEEAAKNYGLPVYKSAVKNALTLIRFKSDNPKIDA